MQNNIPSPLNFDNYTFRCSSLGKLMGEAKSKSSQEKLDKKNQEIEDLKIKMKEVAIEKQSGNAYQNQEEKLSKLKFEAKELKELVKEESETLPSLPETCFSYLLEVYVQEKYKIKKDIYSKYFEKGIAKEDEAIEFLSDVHGNFYEKCTLPRKKNEFIEGECDILFEGEKKIVLDIKNAWDLFTFFKAKNSETNKDYKYQGIGYLKLYEAVEFWLCYMLMNMPENLIQDELSRILYQYGKDNKENPTDEFESACREFIKKATFDHLEPKERVYDEIRIIWNEETENEYNNLVERIKLCRKWLNYISLKEHQRTYGIIVGVNDVMPKMEIKQEFAILIESPIEKKEIEVALQEKSNDIFEETHKPHIVELSSRPNCENEIEPKEKIIIIDEKVKPTVKQIIEETKDKINKEGILEDIEKCISKQELQSLYQENENIIIELDDIEIQQAFSNKELSFNSENNELSLALGKLEECKNVIEVRTLYKSCESIISTYPELKQKLIEKRDFFIKQQEELIKQESKPEVEKPKSTKPSPSKPTIKEEPKEKTEQELFIEEVKKKADECKTQSDLASLYKSPEVFDRICYRVIENDKSIVKTKDGMRDLKKYLESVLVKLPE